MGVAPVRAVLQPQIRGLGDLEPVRLRPGDQVDLGELAQQLAEGLIRRYNELRARKDGVAVVELRDGTCQGCFLELTPGEMEEGREMGVLGLARCVQCGRLLVEPVRG